MFIFSKVVEKQLMIKNFIKRNPKIENAIIQVKRIFVAEEPFIDSLKYWENRYRRRGDSGPGSYNNLAEFKQKQLIV